MPSLSHIATGVSVRSTIEGSHESTTIVSSTVVKPAMLLFTKKLPRPGREDATRPWSSVRSEELPEGRRHLPFGSIDVLIVVMTGPLVVDAWGGKTVVRVGGSVVDNPIVVIGFNVEGESVTLLIFRLCLSTLVSSNLFLSVTKG